jgi:hypothetical protein
MNAQRIDVSRLRAVLDYYPDTGELTWKPRSHCEFSSLTVWKAWMTKYNGKPALTALNGNGYHRGNVDKVGVLAHRAAFAVFYGIWPSGDIDHINGIRTDNRIINLREVSRQENMQNQKRSARSTSGVTGVSFDPVNQKWRARATVGNKEIHLGRHESFDAAVTARREAQKRFGFHENHGRDK